MLLKLVLLTAPLFLLVLLGYALVRWWHWSKEVSDALTRFVFSVAIPALLFRMMAGISSLPTADPRLLLAYFGACLLVFAIGRLLQLPRQRSRSGSHEAERWPDPGCP